MKIEFPEVQGLINYKEVFIGETFIYEDMLYLKCNKDGDGRNQAVDLLNGYIENGFGDTDQVQKVNTKVVFE